MSATTVAKRKNVEEMAGQANPDLSVTPDASEEKDYTTPGETKFDKDTYFWWAGVGTFIFTLGLAYLVKDSSIKVPFTHNKETGEKYTFKDGYKKLSQDGADWFVKKGWLKAENAKSIVGSAMLTTATFLGGNVPVPIIRQRERNKAKIVRKNNEKLGTADDVIQGEKNVKDEAPQSWWSLIKGRVAAWAIVFITFAGIGAKLIPNTFKGLEKDFENRAGNVGGFIHKWKPGSQKFFEATGKGPQLELNEKAALPAGTTDKQHQQMYRYKRLGNLAAVDVFATAMSATLLYVASKFFAKKAQEKKQPTKHTPTPIKIEKHAQSKLEGKEKLQEAPTLDKEAKKKVEERSEAVKAGERPGPSRHRRAALTLPTAREGLAPKAIGYADEEYKKREKGGYEPNDEVGVQL